MYANKKRGQSMVEFALLAPFIFLVLATIIEGSPLINAYIKVEKAAQTGAHTAAIYGTTDNEILTPMLLDLYKMTYKAHYDNFEEASVDNGGVSQVKFSSNCPLTASNKPYVNYNEELYLDEDAGLACFSKATERNENGTSLTEITIQPTLRYRINGSWATVSVLHNYRVYTPILFFVADFLTDSNDTNNPPSFKTVPIFRYATQKVQ